MMLAQSICEQHLNGCPGRCPRRSKQSRWFECCCCCCYPMHDDVPVCWESSNLVQMQTSSNGNSISPQWKTELTYKRSENSTPNAIGFGWSWLCKLLQKFTSAVDGISSGQLSELPTIIESPPDFRLLSRRDSLHLISVESRISFESSNFTLELSTRRNLIVHQITQHNGKFNRLQLPDRQVATRWRGNQANFQETLSCSQTKTNRLGSQSTFT